MTDHTFNRRHFLRSTAKVGMAADPGEFPCGFLPRPFRLNPTGTLIPIPEGLEILKLPDVQKTLAAR